MTTVPAAPAAPEKRSAVRDFLSSRPIQKLRRNKLAMLGLIAALLFLLVGFFAPLIARPSVGSNCLRDLGASSPQEIANPLGGVFWKAHFAAPDSCYAIERESFSPTPSPPSAEAPFGTSQGYDIFYGLIWGTRTMFKLSFIIVGITLLVGVIIGAISGYYGGWIDNLIQRFIDVLFALPGLVLTIILITFLKASNPGIDPAFPIIAAYTVTGWASYARIVRGDVLRTRQLEFVDAARSLGARDWRLIRRHIIPNSLASVITLAVLDLGTIPLSIAALSFLGLGFPTGYAEWGQLVDFARAWLQPQYWYVMVYPAAFIILFSLAFNLFGDALRDAYDPKTR
ncbi:peptide/nickel transport system permease protein [Deinococcus sp. HSC-46F16]|uniref:ABC transporter permease n=1 Tax=Deinococcus sp. HSC-46F16 TaxID=2910968 RepID=UPI0020A1EA5D|nr:ABC transporter permease [Deinococcus sp. HSC-46F16]MCP2015422.1 peptide/nickel transport system permease protein [Deinococcus sp. HSC-46F16]